jgi:hypothetical protein
MRIKKTIVMREDDGALLPGDTIEYERKLWLVTAWLAGPTEKTERPERIICLDGLPMQPAGPKYPAADFVLSTPLPKAFLEGHAVMQGVVIERPDIIRNV